MNEGNGRQLAGGVARKVLVVRVLAPDRTTTADPATLSGDFFGTGKVETAVSMRERLRSCSYGEIDLNPFSGSTPSGAVIQNGVVEVQIGTAVNGQGSQAIQNLVLATLRNNLGISTLSNTFDHVMLCLPWGTVGPGAVPTQAWIAYGTLE
jgi:hypothetical protein